MEELTRLADLAETASEERHLIWAAQAQGNDVLGLGVRAWRHGGALAVTSPDLSGRDRLAITGDHVDAIALVRHVLAEVGDSYWPFGDVSLLGTLVAELSLVPAHEFLWMQGTTPPAHPAPGVQWLGSGQEKEVALLFDRFFPNSFAQPGGSDAHRWAGALGDLGTAGALPLAVAADAWSAPGCGFLAGVLTHPDARGRGLAPAVCGFVLDALVRQYGRAALMVHADNTPAIAIYERLGMTRHAFWTARMPTR